MAEAKWLERCGCIAYYISFTNNMSSFRQRMTTSRAKNQAAFRRERDGGRTVLIALSSPMSYNERTGAWVGTRDLEAANGFDANPSRMNMTPPVRVRNLRERPLSLQSG